MDEEEPQISGPVRVGMIWGVVGGVAGFAASLIATSFGGLVAAILIGVACGRRAASPGEENPGRSGLVSGALAAPGLMLGAAAGTVLVTQRVGMQELASTASEVAGMTITSQEAWQFFLGGVVLAALLQAAVLILTAVLAAGRTARKKGNGSGTDDS